LTAAAFEQAARTSGYEGQIHVGKDLFSLQLP
jgi:hypothetical protein